MAMPQRDDTIEAIKRLDALLEYAVMHETKPRPSASAKKGPVVALVCGRSAVAGRPPYRNGRDASEGWQIYTVHDKISPFSEK